MIRRRRNRATPTSGQGAPIVARRRAALEQALKADTDARQAERELWDERAAVAMATPNVWHWWETEQRINTEGITTPHGRIVHPLRDRGYKCVAEPSKDGSRIYLMWPTDGEKVS